MPFCIYVSPPPSCATLPIGKTLFGPYSPNHALIYQVRA